MKNERGQTMLLTVVFLVVLMGCAALTLDVGVWYREQRQAQATADAAALAGAQALPTSPANAVAWAKQYADSNGGGVDAADITLRDDVAVSAKDTVAVQVTRTAPSFFATVFSFGDVNVHAHAAARAGVPEAVEGAAPIVVSKFHPLLAGPGCPCFNQETTLPLAKTGAPGAFGMVDFNNSGSNGNPDLADWIQNGFDGMLEVNSPYDSDPGAKFNSGGLTNALQARVGTELLFPVFDTLDSAGSNAQYDVIGWVAFHLDCFGLAVGSTDCTNQNGNNQTLTGYFTRAIWKGLQSKNNKHLPDFGLYSVSLVN